MKLTRWSFLCSCLALLPGLSGCSSNSNQARFWLPGPSLPGPGNQPSALASAVPDCEVVITAPHPGQEVAGRIDAAGIAKLPSDYYLWIFARRVSYRPLDFWWPQGVAIVENGAWSIPVSIGNEFDVGKEFDVTAAVFDRAKHLELRDYFHNAVKANDYQPMAMPAAVCVSNTVVVRKTSK